MRLRIWWVLLVLGFAVGFGDLLVCALCAWCVDIRLVENLVKRARVVNAKCEVWG